MKLPGQTSNRFGAYHIPVYLFLPVEQQKENSVLPSRLAWITMTGKQQNNNLRYAV